MLCVSHLIYIVIFFKVICVSFFSVCHFLVSLLSIDMNFFYHKLFFSLNNNWNTVFCSAFQMFILFDCDEYHSFKLLFTKFEKFRLSNKIKLHKKYWILTPNEGTGATILSSPFTRFREENFKSKKETNKFDAFSIGFVQFDKQTYTNCRTI